MILFAYNGCRGMMLIGDIVLLLLTKSELGLNFWWLCILFCLGFMVEDYVLALLVQFDFYLALDVRNLYVCVWVFAQCLTYFYVCETSFHLIISCTNHGFIILV